MAINPSFWRSIGKTDAAFLTVVNRAFHTNLPTALSAQTWLTSVGYYTDFVYRLPTFPIFAGAANSAVLYTDGQVWTWGYNDQGQIGDNSTESKCTPVSIQGAKKTFCSLALGTQGLSGIDKNGQVWSWGNNNKGQIGDNSIICTWTPVSIHGVKKTFCKIYAGKINGIFKSAIDQYGQVWTWGNNQYGQLGDDSITSRCTPVSILGAKKTFCEISCGDNYIIGSYNGQLWGWGLNANGQIGDNSKTSRQTPVSIQGAKKTFCQISAGSTHTMSLDNYGQIWAWGSNTKGQLGNNSTVSIITPISIYGIKKTFCKISSGNSFSTGLDKYGQAWGWGYNWQGQIGNNSSGTAACQCTPVSIHGTKKTFCEISSANDYSLALDNRNNVWAWGSNVAFVFGDNSNTNRCTPVRICHF